MWNLTICKFPNRCQEPIIHWMISRLNYMFQFRFLCLLPLIKGIRHQNFVFVQETFSFIFFLIEFICKYTLCLILFSLRRALLKPYFSLCPAYPFLTSILTSNACLHLLNNRHYNQRSVSLFSLCLWLMCIEYYLHNQLWKR